MSKKTAIIFILVVFLGAFGALIWFYLSIGTEKATTPAPVKMVDVYDPFGTKTTPTTPVDNNDQNTDDLYQNVTQINKLRQITADPISGFSLIENKQTGKTDIHYILRANANIYETYADSPENKRLSITTIPKIYESLWLPDGQKLIVRYLKDNNEDIETFSVKINPATTTLNEFEGGIDGNHLPENISTMAINPLGDKIFYLTDNLNGASGYIAKPDGLNKKLIFESPLIEWLVSWPKEETITLTTKPSAKIPGYLFFLNSQTGNFSKILGNINGLTTKVKNGATEILYSDSVRNTPRLYLYNVKNSESKLLPWNTFPEKCVWSNTDTEIIYCAVPKTFGVGEYPDLWYQGLASFADNIWQINTNTMSATLIYDFEKENGRSIDIVDIQIDAKDNYLFFINKTDLTFWSLNLK